MRTPLYALRLSTEDRKLFGRAARLSKQPTATWLKAVARKAAARQIVKAAKTP